MLQTFFQIIIGVVSESFHLLAKMAPYLILGFFFAGILSEFVSAERIARHLGKGNITSVIKAALFGMPLPLCSCGVIPTTMALRKNGASRSAVLSFLISTPTTGVDSIFTTYSLLGPVFAVYRILASFFAGVFSGVAAIVFGPKEKLNPNEQFQPQNQSQSQVQISLGKRFLKVFRYAFVELFSEIAKWLMIGILIGGVISYLIPEDFFSTYLREGWQAILVMMVIGIPLYVCATGSIPIAAALMLKGINPGAAFVFLLAGPATNAVTVTVISKYLGTRTSIIYLTSIAFSSVGLALLLDKVWLWLGLNLAGEHAAGHGMLPQWLEIGGAILILLLAISIPLRRRYPTMFSQKKKITDAESLATELVVPDMSCNHCAVKIQNSVGALSGIANVMANPTTKKVRIEHAADVTNSEIAEAIRSAGYNVE
jgi:copper ion binding protein